MPDCDDMHTAPNKGRVQTTAEKRVELFAQIRPAAAIAEIFDVLHPMPLQDALLVESFGDGDRIDDQCFIGVLLAN
jgi:hypothetical protein